MGGGSASSSISAGLAGDFVLDGYKRPEYVYLGLESDNHEPTSVKEEQVAKWRTAEATPNPNSGKRLSTLVALSGGFFHVQGTTTWTVFNDTADPRLAAAANYYWMVEHGEKVYMGDGTDYMVYDPKTAVLEEWKSEGAGALPEKCRLAAVYHGRMVLAQSEGEPYNWFMSAVDLPNEWDYFPPTFTVDQAIAGNLSEAGKCPDIINALIPYHDDLLIFGCDHSIWVLRGDPMSSGRLDDISKTIGIAAGDAWCRDEAGIIYFFGSKGGVYRMAPGSPPEVLSDSRGGQDVSIHRRLTEIDLGAYRVDMAWDFERQGCIVMVIPFAEDESEIQESYFWSQKVNGWFPDQVGLIGLQAYCVSTVDGDLPDDRRVVVGCQDGYARSFERDAVNDDGTAIQSRVLIGPMTSGTDDEITLTRVKAVLTSGAYGCDFDVFVSSDPDNMGSAVFTGRFVPGQNPRLPVRKRGSFLWVKLYNNALGERWSIDQLSADLRARGVRRVRA